MDLLSVTLIMVGCRLLLGVDEEHSEIACGLVDTIGEFFIVYSIGMC